MSTHTSAVNGPATWESSVRGLVIGMALGDAIGSKASEIPEKGPLLAGAATQLAAFTLEGMIRATARIQRSEELGPWLIKEGYLRWAAVRGYSPEKLKKQSHWYSEREGEVISPGGVGWPDGWLAHVPAMKEKRGTSPSTVQSLLSGAPVASSGCQGFLRTLPIAAWRGVGDDSLETVAFMAGACTHKAIGIAPPAAALYLRRCLESTAVPRMVDRPRGMDEASPAWPYLTRTLPEIASSQPCVTAVLKKLAPDRSAGSALVGGLYTAFSFPDPDTVMEALEFAAWAPDGDSVAAVTGAILGAVHGIEVFPVELVSRLELGWVIDTLARDLCLTLNENQAGTKTEPPLNSRWLALYPPC